VPELSEMMQLIGVFKTLIPKLFIKAKDNNCPKIEKNFSIDNRDLLLISTRSNFNPLISCIDK
jgi:hypothetical protein